jgi:hypothetical protein
MNQIISVAWFIPIAVRYLATWTKVYAKYFNNFCIGVSEQRPSRPQIDMSEDAEMPNTTAQPTSHGPRVLQGGSHLFGSDKTVRPPSCTQGETRWI